ncbi:MAG: hypothetical protein JNM14_07925 [Ferruginibacter sp.]|nr:hypothetical protein [Ferruginibacter sp.]
MLKNLVFAAIILISIASCKSSKKKAFDYSENFVKKEKSISDDITKTEEKVARYAAVQQYDSIAIAGEKMEKLVDDKIQEIKKEPVPDVKEAANFKEACIKYFTFIKALYTAYKDFGKASSDTEREAVRTKLVELTDKKQAVIDDIKAAQKKFADANDFKLEK